MHDDFTKDVLDRARSEVALLVRQYQRRLKERAEAIVRDDLTLNGPANRSAEEVGRAAFAKAGQQLGLITDEPRPALTGPSS